MSHGGRTQGGTTMGSSGQPIGNGNGNGSKNGNGENGNGENGNGENGNGVSDATKQAQQKLSDATGITTFTTTGAVSTTPTPSASKIFYSGIPETATTTPTPNTPAYDGYYAPTGGAQLTKTQLDVKLGITPDQQIAKGEFGTLNYAPQNQMPPNSDWSQAKYDEAVKLVGVEQANKLATATYSSVQELNQFLRETIVRGGGATTTQQMVTAQKQIETAQRQDKVRPLTPEQQIIHDAQVTYSCVGTKCEVISQPTTTPASSIKSILPFVIIGILALVVIIILRARS